MKTIENQIHDQGYEIIAGLDEAGRGCWAGPLVVAICAFKKDYVNLAINDSKKLNVKQRHLIFEQITKDAYYWNYLVFDAAFVDQYNPKRTSILGMETLVKNAAKKLDFVLVDWEKIDTDLPVKSLAKGDQKSQAIAAASIIAKTIRDQLIDRIDRQFPQYGFKQHQGYGTKIHQAKLEAFGPIDKIHRFSYKPIKLILTKNKC